MSETNPKSDTKKAKMPAGKTARRVRHRAPTKASPAKKTKSPRKVQKALTKPLKRNTSASQNLALWRQNRAAEHQIVNAKMLRDRQSGRSIQAIAKKNKISTKTVYQRLARARQAITPPIASTFEEYIARSQQPDLVSAVTERDERRELSYLRGRVDQLETLFSQLFKLGVGKVLRAITP